MTIPNTYAILLGDLLSNGSIDVNGRSRNGDTRIMLNTVFKIISEFLGEEPDAKVFVEGSSASRTRLYQIAIAMQINVLRNRFDVLGVVAGELEEFRIGKQYSAFVISLKK